MQFNEGDTKRLVRDAIKKYERALDRYALNGVYLKRLKPHAIS
jgi:hypothetical protein